jgi:hypothetical protein
MVNVDASFNPEILTGEIGAVIRDDHGRFIVACNVLIQYAIDANTLEAYDIDANTLEV